VNLYYLHLEFNKLSGTIPPSLGNMTTMHDLCESLLSLFVDFNRINIRVMNNNLLSGPIPIEVILLPNALWLYIPSFSRHFSGKD
jgi:hypothetical protein